MMGWWIYSWYWGQAGLGCGCWPQLTVSETNGALWLVSGRDPGIWLALTSSLARPSSGSDGFHNKRRTLRTLSSNNWQIGGGAEWQHGPLSDVSTEVNNAEVSENVCTQPRTPAATLWMSLRDTGHTAHTILCCLPAVIKIICFQSWLFIQFVKVSNIKHKHVYFVVKKKTRKDQKISLIPSSSSVKNHRQDKVDDTGKTKTVVQMSCWLRTL